MPRTTATTGFFLAIVAALMLFATTPVVADNTGNKDKFKLPAYAVEPKGTMEFDLGVKYARGEGVPESDAKAAQLFTKAAKQGHPKAQFRLGLIYATGEGVPESHAKAVHWYTKAAKQGNALAQSNLAMMYTHGRGVPKDDVLAYAWINIAAPQIGLHALLRKTSIAKSMTPTQIAEAQKLLLELWEKYVVPFQKE